MQYVKFGTHYSCTRAVFTALEHGPSVNTGTVYLLYRAPVFTACCKKHCMTIARVKMPKNDTRIHGP